MDVGRLVLPNNPGSWVGVRALAETLNLSLTWSHEGDELIVEGRLDHVLLVGLILARVQ